MSWENHGEWHIDHIKLGNLLDENEKKSVFITKISNLYGPIKIIYLL